MSEDATITRIVFDAAIWREGYYAGRRGRELEANPYPARTLKARAWQVGHAEAARSRCGWWIAARPAQALLRLMEETGAGRHSSSVPRERQRQRAHKRVARGEARGKCEILPDRHWV